MFDALPPGPGWALPATLGLIRNPYQTLRDLRRIYGDLATFPGLNGRVVLAMNPELAREILVAPADTFSTFAAGTLGAVLGTRSLVVSDGEQHRQDRKLLTPPFHGARMKTYGDIMRRVARRRFEAGLVPGQTATMHDLTTAITLDVILGAVFGVADGPALEEGRRLVSELATISPLLLFTRWSHTALFPPYRRFSAARAQFGIWLQSRVDQARVAPGEDILSLMLAARYDDGSAMSAEDLQSQLMTLLFAGHETTAIALAWAVHWLWRHPDALARLREELATVDRDGDPEAIAKIPFLGAVCDETLRLRPIVTENLRTLRQPLQVGAYTLPAGVGVGVGIAPIHEDPAIYQDPHAFRPERFLERKFSPFEYLPFGGGFRRCIGAAFAAYEMRLALAVLVDGWDLELLCPEEQPTRRNATMGPQFGVPVRIISRRG